MNEKKHININKLKTWVIAHPLISQIVASLIIGFVLTVIALFVLVIAMIAFLPLLIGLIDAAFYDEISKKQ